jgi:hypothetical protein
MRRLIQAMIVLPLPGMLVAIWYALADPEHLESWAGLLGLASAVLWLFGRLAARAFDRRVLRSPPAQFGRTPTIDDIGLGWLTPLGGGIFLAGITLLRGGDSHVVATLMISWVISWLFMELEVYFLDNWRHRLGALSDFFRSRF